MFRRSVDCRNSSSKKLIREARKAAVSIRQLSRLTGISKTKIERIAKEKKQTEDK